MGCEFGPPQWQCLIVNPTQLSDQMDHPVPFSHSGQVEGVLPQVSAGHPAEAARGVRQEPAEDHRAAAQLLREEQGAAEAEAERELCQEPGK